MRAARVVCWGFDLGEDVGFGILWDHYNPRCVPEWSEPELRKKCRDAMDPATADNPRGWLRDADDGRTPAPADWLGSLAGPVAAATPTPAAPGGPAGQGEPVAVAESAVQLQPTIGIEDDDPHRLARLFLARFDHPDGCRLRYWAGEFCVWSEGAYDLTAEDELRGDLTRFVEQEFRRLHSGRVRVYQINREKGSEEKPPRKQRVTRNLISDVLQAIRGEVGIPSRLGPPCWLGDGPPAAELVAARNGLVHLPSLAAGLETAFTRSSPRFFTFNRVGFDFEQDAPEPRHWLRFLDQLWPDDPDSVACLQEWFGYLLTPDTSLHKMLLVIGPPRAGKGTIARVLKALLGERNIAAPTLGKLAEQFGLQDLIGKPVAMISDARLSGRTDAVAITEELLSISGEDTRTIPRKHIESLTMKLPTRFVFMSNEMPQLGDASGAILGRMVILRLTRSFLGREDLTLIDRLLPELPGILLWAAKGWERLRGTGRFTAPESAAELIEEAEAITSPIRVFIRERIEVAEDAFTETRELYAAWVDWCKKRGRENIDHQERFVAKLRAALPDITSRRVRSGGNRSCGYSGLRLLSEYEAGDIPL